MRDLFVEMRLVALTRYGVTSRDDPRIAAAFDGQLEKPVSLMRLERVLIGLFE